MRQHCCIGIGRYLQVAVDSSATAAVGDRPLLYDPVFDEYRLLVVGMPDEGAVLVWCPWCGRRLPSSRRSAWFVRLSEAGLTPDDPLPDELTTDRWWAGEG